MRPVSPLWKATVSSSHHMIARARLCTAGQEGTNPGPFNDDGTPKFQLSIVDGDVEFDASAEIRATTDLTVAAEWPADIASELNPYGAYDLFVERGVVHGDGSREWVSLGYYRIDDLEQAEAPSGPITIAAPDRMAQILDERLEEPRQYDASASIRFLVEDLVHEVYPGLTVTIEGFDPDVALGTSRIVDENRYEFLNDIAKAHGCVMHFDYDGTFVMKPVPEPTLPVATVSGGPGGVLVRRRRRLTRKGLYNAVVANGEQVGEEDPVRGVARNTNPLSPTRWGGPFGHVPRLYDSSFLKTDEQCQNAAQAMLDRITGLPYTVSFEQVPNPALEPLDPVSIEGELHVLDRMSIPLIATRTMRAETRAQPRSAS